MIRGKRSVLLIGEAWLGLLISLLLTIGLFVPDSTAGADEPPDEDIFVYLPVVLNSEPPSVPSVPVLDDISNPDGDGDYTVTWSAVSGATSYTLEEDDGATFPSPTTVYSGPDTSRGITGKDAGTYYYRVKASNVSGSSDWSSTESVTVQPTGPAPGHYTGTPSVSFDVGSDQQVCNFDITVPFESGTCRIRPDGCGEIVDSEFTFVKDHPVFVMPYYQITGTFETSTDVLGDYAVWICGNQLIVTPSEGTWEASKQSRVADCVASW